MAFVSGFNVVYKCKLCKAECDSHLRKDMTKFVYEHPYKVMMINGYPGICDKAGKTLEADEIEIVDEPIIESGGFRMY